MTTKQTKTKLKTKQYLVTPKRAAEWLQKNAVNRPLSLTRVKKYAHAMKEGQWQGLNGETLIFSSSPGDPFARLMNGQHRLGAVVESGVSVPMLVVTGVKEEAFITLDSGDSRSMSDWLKIRGEKHYAHLAGALSRLWYYEQSGGISLYNAGMDVTPTKDDLNDLLEKRSKLRDSVEFCVARRTNLIPGSILACAHFIFAKTSREKADDFIDKVVTGENMPKTHPVMLLRKRLIERREVKVGPKLPVQAVCYLLFRAWKAFYKGETLVKLQLPKTGEYSLRAEESGA